MTSRSMSLFVKVKSSFPIHPSPQTLSIPQIMILILLLSLLSISSELQAAHPFLPPLQIWASWLQVSFVEAC